MLILNKIVKHRTLRLFENLAPGIQADLSYYFSCNCVGLTPRLKNILRFLILLGVKLNNLHGLHFAQFGSLGAPVFKGTLLTVHYNFFSVT